MRRSAIMALAVMAAPALAQLPAATPSDQAVNAGPATAQGNVDDQRVVCRTLARTGSLIERDRACKTIAEWRRLARSGNDYAREMVDVLTSRPETRY